MLYLSDGHFYDMLTGQDDWYSHITYNPPYNSGLATFSRWRVYNEDDE